MTEKIEMGSVPPEQPKITNLAELKTLLEREFGIYFFFLNASLKKLSGYETPKSMFPDTEKEKEREKVMFENARVTPEIIETLNKVITHRAKIMETEVEWAKQRNKGKHWKECQEILDLFKNKQLILTKEGIIEIQELDN